MFNVGHELILINTINTINTNAEQLEKLSVDTGMIITNITNSEEKSNLQVCNKIIIG